MKQLSKKFLSGILSAAIVLSSLLFCVNTSASAADGDYTLVFTYEVTDDADKKGNIQDSYWTIYYKPDNGTGAETTMTYSLLDNFSTCLEGENTKNIEVTVPGWPTKVYYYHDAAWTDGVTYYMYTITVNGVTTWEGSEKIKSGGFGNSEAEGTLTFGAETPKASTVTGEYASSSVTAPKPGASSITNQIQNLVTTDQYGVKVTADVTYTYSQTASTGVTTSSAGLTTVSSLANSAGTTDSKTITTTVTASFGGGTPTVAAQFTVNDCTLSYKFVNQDGSVLSSGSLRYGNTPSTPASTPSKSYDSSYHYTFNGWSPAVSELTADSTVYTAQYISEGHSYSAWSSNGNHATHYRSCTKCAYAITANCAYSSFVTAPTCTGQGYTTHTCSTCGDSYIDTYVDALGHSWQNYTSNGDQKTHTRICSVCKITETGDCSYSSTVTAPTCTEQGYTTHTCSTCGDSYIDTYVDALGHSWQSYSSNGDKKTHSRICSVCKASETEDCSYSSTVTAPTCTEQGYTTHTCSVCGDSYKDTYVATVAHSWQEYISNGDETHTRICSVCKTSETQNCSCKSTITAPTCTEQGYTTHTCVVCGGIYIDTYVAAKGHTWGDYNRGSEKNTHKRSCLVCNETETENCTYNDAVTEPTCTEQGYTRHTCSVCGSSYKDTYVDALGHSYGILQILQPANNKNGYIWYTCSRCVNFFSVNNDGSPADVYGTEEEAKNNSEVPAPALNAYISSKYNYSARGAALRYASIDDEADAAFVDENEKYKVNDDSYVNCQQATRFTASLKFPTGATITNYGFVMSQTELIEGENENKIYEANEKLTIGADNVYEFSNANGYIQNFTDHTDDDTTTKTFNLVLKIKAGNWKKCYAVRSFVTYVYKGQTFTVYDDNYSSRSVDYIANQVINSDSEATEVKNFFQNKVLNYTSL